MNNMQNDTYFKKNKDIIFKKYSDDELVKDINSYRFGKGRLNKVLNHFFEECMFECCGKKTKISPMQVLKSDNLVEKILEYISTKPKFFTSKDEVSNVKSAIRNSFSWVRKVANFCPVNARNIYFRYNNIKDRPINILDTSMGFGSRFSAVMLSGHNYYGIDPNKSLFNKMEEYRDFLLKAGIIKPEQVCEIRCCGSETHIDEFDEKIDVSFTSPPYFNLEKYADDNCGSTKNYYNYKLWVDNFVKPTVLNTYKYLKLGGYAMINIKNINKKETCFDDFYRSFEEINGFEFVETFYLEIPSKKQYGMKYENKKGNISTKEPIMVFRKIK